MTGEEFYQSLRALVRDDTRGYAIDDTLFSDSEIEQVATQTRLRLFTTLVKMGKLLTVNRQLKLAFSTAGNSVPSDFWRLEIGRTSNGYWVNAEPFKLAEAMSAQGLPSVYVRKGVFKGTSSTAYYWAKPTTLIQKNKTSFGDFPDTFYHAVITGTAIELLKKESAGMAGSITELSKQLAGHIQLMQ